MSHFKSHKINCPYCNHEQETHVYESINVSSQPELKDLLLEGKLNQFVCGNCGQKAQIDVQIFIYNDTVNRIWIQYLQSEDWYLPRKKMLDAMATKHDYRVKVCFEFNVLLDLVSRPLSHS